MGAYVDVASLIGGWISSTLGLTNVVHELPTNLIYVMPLVVVERFGGADDTITLDVARLDVDVFCPDRASALSQGERIRQAMRTQLVGYTALGTTVMRVATISAPTIAPFDSRDQVRRCTQSVQVHLHQYAGV